VTAGARHHGSRPNILLILSDQHNPRIAGFAGDAYARTGHLDDLAAAGTSFGAAYCQSPLCVPSRISMLTGKYSCDCSAWDNRSLLDSGHRTFAEHLSEHGYATCAVGKMHLAGERWMGGFDHRPYGDLRVTRFPFHQPDPPETWDGRWNRHSVGRFPWAGESRIPESLLVDGIVTREALSFLREYQSGEDRSPWLMMAGYSRPHFPLTAPARYVRRALADPPPLAELPAGYPDEIHPHDRFIVEDFNLTEFSPEEQRRALACYYACVDYVDDCIGELLAGLRAGGQLENTVVIYASDHGDLAGEHGLWWKRSYYDGSARVPLLISGPGLAAGAGCGAPVELVDVYPTLCDLAGAPIPAGLAGESLLPLCRGEDAGPRKQRARCDFLPGGGRTSFRMVRDRRWKYAEFPEGPPVLFDLQEDPGETRNLIIGGGAPREAPLDELRDHLHAGPDWEGARAMEAADTERWSACERPELTAPAQYMLEDGRVVDADRFLYPGM